MHFGGNCDPASLQGSELLRDARNVELLRLLRKDRRATISALARAVGMSAPAIRERMQRLEETGVIQGYGVQVDPLALGYPISAFVRVRPVPGKLPTVIELVRSMPQVTECHRITGEDCLIFRVYLKSVDRLDEVLDRFVAFGHTTTSLVQSSPVPGRALPLPGEIAAERAALEARLR